MEVADRIVVMNDGAIEQVGTPATSSTSGPANEFVMSFIGPVNQLGHAYVRPHDIDIFTEPTDGASEAMIERILYLGLQLVLLFHGDGAVGDLHALHAALVDERQVLLELALAQADLEERAAEAHRDAEALVEGDLLLDVRRDHSCAPAELDDVDVVAGDLDELAYLVQAEPLVEGARA